MQGINLLVVDDEKDFIEPLSKRLSLRKINVLTAHSGEKALEILTKEPIDVVLLDVMMPGMDGIETIRAIKKAHPLLEVILLTGHASLEASIQGMALGAFDYLLKPVALDELVYKIEDAYRKRCLQQDKINCLKAKATNTGP